MSVKQSKQAFKSTAFLLALVSCPSCCLPALAENNLPILPAVQAASTSVTERLSQGTINAPSLAIGIVSGSVSQPGSWLPASLAAGSMLPMSPLILHAAATPMVPSAPSTAGSSASGSLQQIFGASSVSLALSAARQTAAPSTQTQPSVRFFRSNLQTLPGTRTKLIKLNAEGTPATRGDRAVPAILPMAGTNVEHLAPDRVKLSEGRLLIAATRAPAVVETSLARIRIGRSTDVLVDSTEQLLRIKNLDGTTNGVQISLDGIDHVVALAPGYELVASRSALLAEQILAPDGIGRRNPVLENSGTIAVTEVRLADVVRQQLRHLRESTESEIVRRVIKTAAILDTTRGITGFVNSLLSDNGLPPVIPPIPQIPVPPALIVPPIAPVPPLPIPPAEPSSTDATPPQALPAPAPPDQLVPPAVATDITRSPYESNRDATRQRPPSELPSGSQSRAPSPPLANRQEAAPGPGALPGPDLSTTADRKPSTPENGPSTSIAGRKPAPGRVQAQLGPITSPDGLNRSATESTTRARPGYESPVLETVKDAIRQFPELALLAILLIAALLLLSLILARAAVIRARELTAANKRLEAEIAERRAAEQQVSHLNADLQHKLAELARLNTDLEIARDEALQASRLKSEFVANITHEIRTPISAVIGVNELLMTGELTSRQRELAQLVDASARSLLTVINDILDFSKIEAGMLDLNIAPFELEMLMQEVMDTVYPGVQGKDLSISVVIDKDAPQMLTGDQFRLRQVLVNLVGNAIKFTAAGQILVSVELVPQSPQSVRFSVKDTGIGIPIEAQAKLFQPFVQVDGSTSRRFGGSGLGLSISKRLVELMNGKMYVESEPGNGSRFWFDVPLVEMQ